MIPQADLDRWRELCEQAKFRTISVPDEDDRNFYREARTAIPALLDEIERLKGFDCSAVLWHGPGHQSKTTCQRRSPHELNDEHYVSLHCEEVEWEGAEAHA